MATWAMIADWDRFQHYQNRAAPPWIKLHRGILDSRRFQCLPLASKALAPQIWLIASENCGRIDIDADELQFRLRWPIEEIRAGINPLIDNGYLILEGECYQRASTPLAERLQDATPEREERESTRESREDSVCVSGARARALETEQPPDDVSRETQSVLDAWADFTGSPIVSLGEIRAVASQIAQLPDGSQSLLAVIARARGSPFLRGEQGNWGGMPLKWLLSEQRRAEILRGEHDGRKGGGIGAGDPAGTVDIIRKLQAEYCDGDGADGKPGEGVRLIAGGRAGGA